MRFASAGGYPMQLVILAAFAILIAYATQMLRKGGPAIGQAVGTLLAGIAIVDALAVSTRLRHLWRSVLSPLLPFCASGSAGWPRRERKNAFSNAS
jgi:hypothetical protein